MKGIISEQFNTETSYNTVREVLNSLASLARYLFDEEIVLFWQLYRNLTESSVSGMINGSELVNHIEDRIRSKLLLVESLLQVRLRVMCT